MAIGSEARSTFLAVVKGDASQAVTEFKKLGNSVEKSTKGAEGSVGKFKRATSGAFADIKANAGMMAAGAGVAIAGFAVKAASDFSNLGVEIGKFSDATGLATEDASRWIEVAGDLGLESSSVQTALGRLNKSINPELFKQYGIEIAKTSSGMTDVNGTFLNVIDRLNGMKDPAERAKLATKLLGRGWMELSELIGKGSSDLRKRLQDVSDVKVFDAAKVEKARKFRDVMQQLKDVAEDFAINMGSKVAPQLRRLLGYVEDLQKMGVFNDTSNKNFIIPGDNANNLVNYTANLEAFVFALKTSGLSAQEARPYIEKYIKVTGQGVTELENYSDASKIAAGERMLAKRFEDEKNAAEDDRDAIYELRKSIKGLIDIQTEQIDSKQDVIVGMYEMVDAMKDWETEAGNGTEVTGDLVQTAKDLATKSADLAKEQGELNNHQQTTAERTMTMMAKYDELQSKLKKGSPLWNAIEALKQQLLSVPTDITTTFTVRGVTTRDTTSGKQGDGSLVVGTAANGTPSARRGTYLVGENGPELVSMRGGERVYPTPQTMAMLGGSGGGNVYNVTIAPRVIPTERELIDLLNGLTRRQGAVAVP